MGAAMGPSVAWKLAIGGMGSGVNAGAACALEVVLNDVLPATDAKLGLAPALGTMLLGGFCRM